MKSSGRGILGQKITDQGSDVGFYNALTLRGHANGTHETVMYNDCIILATEKLLFTTYFIKGFNTTALPSACATFSKYTLALGPFHIYYLCAQLVPTFRYNALPMCRLP